MNRIHESRMARWLLLGLAFLPAAVYACQSLFNRLMRDDYHFQRFAYELGFWQSIHHWRETWMTSYTDLAAHALLAPLDRAAPAIAALLMIALSLIGFTWLLQQVTTWLGFSWAGWLPCAALASLVTAAAIAAFYSPQSLHWYSAVVEYGMPVALLPLYLALLLAMGRRAHSRTRLLAAALVSFVTGFLIAGFAEIHIMFQLGFITALLVAGIGLTPRESRQRAALLLGAGYGGHGCGWHRARCWPSSMWLCSSGRSGKSRIWRSMPANGKTGTACSCACAPRTTGCGDPATRL